MDVRITLISWSSLKRYFCLSSRHPYSLQLPSSESSCSVISNGEGLMDLALKLVRYLFWSKFSFRPSLTLNYTGYYSCILLTSIITSSTQHQIQCFEGVGRFHCGGVCFNSLHCYFLIIGVFSIAIPSIAERLSVRHYPIRRHPNTDTLACPC
jgi:hypothetical protein